MPRFFDPGVEMPRDLAIRMQVARESGDPIAYSFDVVMYKLQERISSLIKAYKLDKSGFLKELETAESLLVALESCADAEALMAIINTGEKTAWRMTYLDYFIVELSVSKEGAMLSYKDIRVAIARNDAQYMKASESAQLQARF